LLLILHDDATLPVVALATGGAPPFADGGRGDDLPVTHATHSWGGSDFLEPCHVVY
jgi:hypothetical protein